MANPAFRSYSRDAGAYRRSCAAAIVLRALNPLYSERRKRLPGPDPGEAHGSIHTAAAIRLILSWRCRL